MVYTTLTETKERLHMHKLLVWVARMAATGGVAMILLAVGWRLSGVYWLAGFQLGTILQGGMAMTLVGCLAYVAALAECRQQ
jgi:hypothetical protein